MTKHTEAETAEILDMIKRNIYGLGHSMQDAPYHGFTPDNISGVRFATRKILEGTGLTEENIIREIDEKRTL